MIDEIIHISTLADDFLTPYLKIMNSLKLK
jgi:hypothetical protein